MLLYCFFLFRKCRTIHIITVEFERLLLYMVHTSIHKVYRDKKERCRVFDSTPFVLHRFTYSVRHMPLNSIFYQLLSCERSSICLYELLHIQQDNCRYAAYNCKILFFCKLFFEKHNRKNTCKYYLRSRHYRKIHRHAKSAVGNIIH